MGWATGRNSEVELDLELLIEKELAILVTDGDVEAWLPKSQIGIKKLEGINVRVTLPEWLAEDKELI